MNLVILYLYDASILLHRMTLRLLFDETLHKLYLKRLVIKQLRDFSLDKVETKHIDLIYV